MCRLRAANVLLSGIGGLGAEIAKNLVLAGIKAITILDDVLVSLYYHRRPCTDKVFSTIIDFALLSL